MDYLLWTVKKIDKLRFAVTKKIDSGVANMAMKENLKITSHSSRKTYYEI